MSLNNVIRCVLSLQRPVATVDPSSTRYSLGSALITPATEGRVYVTGCDGRAMSVTLTDGECLDGKEHFAPAEVVAKVGKKGKRAELNGQWLVDNKTLVAPTEGRYPKTSEVLPSFENRKPMMVINLDAELLANVQKSIGGEDRKGLTLIFIDGESAVAVEGQHGIGVVMPLSYRERSETYDDATARQVERYEAKRKEYVAAREGRDNSISDIVKPAEVAELVAAE